MTQQGNFCLPEGLPTRFSEPEDGFTLLCNFLDIANRHRKQTIINIDAVKRALRPRKISFRNLSTSERLRAQITTFYSLPEERQKLWRYIMKSISTSDNKNPADVPSLEHQALMNCYPDFLEIDLEDKNLRISLSEFSGIFESISDAPEWQHPAFAAWIHIRRELLQWDTLSPSRQDEVSIGVFAVATILDDVRFLEWAAERAETLVKEFAFAFVKNFNDNNDTPEKKEVQNWLTEEETGETVRKWNEVCRTISHLASTLGGDDPKPERLDDLIEHVDTLDDLRERLTLVLDTQRTGKFVSHVARLITTAAGEAGVSWLDGYTKKILAHWRLFYIASDNVDVEQLREDVERVERDLKRALSEWRETEQVMRSSQEALQELEVDVHGLGDLLSVDDRKVELQEEITRTAKKLRDARRFLFQVIGPQEQEFDPTRDYERECEDAGVLGEERAEDTRGKLVEDSEEEGEREKEASRRAMSTANSRGFFEATRESISKTDDDRGRELRLDDVADGVEDGVVEGIASEMLARDGGSLGVDLTPAVDGSRPDRPPSPGVEMDATTGVKDTVVVESSSQPDGEDATAVAVFWQSIDAGRLGIAYHIANLRATRSGYDGEFPPANLVAASALADHVQSADGHLVTAVRPLLESIDPDRLQRNECRERDAVNLLLFCAALRPALFAPSTGASSILRRFSAPESLTPVYDLAKAVAGHADRLQGVRLDATLLRATLRGGWQDEFTTFAARVSDWRNRAESQRIIFHRANRVWRDLFSESGCLAELVALMSRDDTGDTERIETIRKQIADQKAFNILVQNTDRRHRRGNPIQGAALKQLWDHVQPAIDFTTEWLRLMDAKPDPKGFVAKRIEVLRRDIVSHGDNALAAIERVMSTETSAALTATLKHARKAISSLRQIFDEDAPAVNVTETSPDVIQSHDLLYVTELDLDMKLRPAAHYGTADILELLLNTAEHAETLADAFSRRLSRQDLTGAQLACDRMDAAADPTVDWYRTSLDREVERQRRELKKAHAEQEGHLERAFCLGQLDINAREDLAAQLVPLKRLVQPDLLSESSLNVANAVASAKSKLDCIRQAIEASRASRLNEVKNRFESLVSTKTDVDDRSIVGQAIESGDILTANELMSRIEDGESVDMPSMTDDPFRAFMSVVDEIEQEVSAPEGLTAQTVVRRVGAREHIDGVSFENLSEEEAAHAASLLRAWYTLSRERRVRKQVLQDLLQRLGFRVRSMSTGRVRGLPQIDLVTETIEDRALCPSRQFGSEARGHYRVLLNWKRSASDSIVESLGIKGSTPTVILHFDCLGADREKLRTLAVEMHRLFLVVDESLILFLAGRSSGRLSALFRCTLPFTSVDPYATTSGLVPPELFYGREREQHEITESFGACFIYGGRQLGKTALLRRVERDYNRSGEANLAKWIDLKVNEIGYARGPRDIWPLLQRELSNLGVVGKQRRELDPENRRQVNTLIDQIRQWVNERKKRRLLLLLDEADAFLEQDARTEFSESAKLKGLMDETERRFKVVFAGLHNVLRTTRQANHPLAHLGDPIRVGAMLSNGEWRQAQALVREPLQAVGCQFERDESSTRILAQTNYYPSLIQLYGAELVRRLRDSNKTFPYVIGDEDINAVYGSKDLRSAIRERFLLTLQLDQRYEVIAYALTQEFHEEADLGHGLDHDTIAEVARAWWPEGFKVTDVEFSMLLHEMEGLGVLRSIDQSRRYTLRNPNILLLLGNRDDIEKALNKKRQRPIVYEPASFRARYPGSHQSSKRRGPLTYRQESDLRAKGGVTIVSGCNAAGVEHVTEFLQRRIGPELFRTLQSVSDQDEFERELRDIRPVRNMVTVYLVPLTADWDISWVAAAKRILMKKAKGRRMWSRVVFTATPKTLRYMPTDSADLMDTDWLDLGPWDERFLRHWLEDINYTADAGHVKELMEVSGGWPTVLEKFGEKPPRKSWSTRIKELNRELIKDRSMQDFGVFSDETKRVLRALVSEDVFDIDSIEVASDEVGLDGVEMLSWVKWSERLGFVSHVDENRWSFNPLIRRLLEASDPK